ASAMVTGLARLGFGVFESATSRYTTISLLLLISTIVLYWQNREVVKKLLPKQAYKPISGLATVIVFVGVISNVCWGIHAFNTQHRLFTYIKTCTREPS